ncbi:MAG: sulfatase-like hydrolase/transferase [Planctomycetota bacterium]|nr:sulfatase-like hydrolase/transferase [Planctomycetota bacterium]
MRFSRILILLGMCLTYLLPLMATSAEERPNFIVIIGDDISWNDYGAYGHPHIRTPHVDQLAKQGMRFDLAFLTTSSCSPSRCSILTGRYPHSTGAGELHQPLPAGQITFAKILKDAGYYTASAGKWHLGNAPRNHFDAIVAGGPSGCDQWVSTLKKRDPAKPFFLWFAAIDAHRGWSKNAVHPPHTPDDVIVPEFLPDTEDVRQDLALYYDEVSRMDEYVGKVVAELKHQGEYDNTVIIIMADNGRPFPRCKTTMYDSGIRTPFVVHWPTGIAGGQVNRNLVSSVDIAPTFLQLAGLKIPASFQGTSFAPTLQAADSKTRDYIFAEHNWHDYAAHDRAVRDDRYLYIRNSFPEFPATPPADAVRSLSYNRMQALEADNRLPTHQRQCFIIPRPAEELYDLQTDPHSLENMADDPALEGVKSRLSGELDKWISQTDDKIPSPLTPDKFHRRLGTKLNAPTAIKDLSKLEPLSRMDHKIPPAGIEIDTAMIAGYQRRLEALNIAMELPQVQGSLSADIQALIKSVQWAVDLGEFYSPAHTGVVDAVLGEAERRAVLLAGGRNDWTRCTGLVVRGYYSSIDGSAQPYGLEIPADIDFSEPVPLYVWLHGRGDKTTDVHFIHQRMTRKGRIAPPNAIVVHPFGRHCMGFKSAGEIDVLECIENVKQQYKIDEQRIVLMGFSMGGAGAWHIGAHYTDRWVAVSPGAGFAETKEYIKLPPEDYPATYTQTLWGTYDVPLYVRNLFNTPVVAYSGEVDKQIQAARVMERAFVSEGRELTHIIGPKMGHQYDPASLTNIMKRMNEAVSKGQSDTRAEVHLQTRTLRYGRMHWIQALALEQHWVDSRIDAEILGNGDIHIQTSNITCFHITKDAYPISDSGAQSRTLTIDDEKFTLPSRAAKKDVSIYTKVENVWKQGDQRGEILSKRPRLQGPIDDAFMAPFLVVLPSGKSAHPEVERWVKFELQHFLHRWKTLYRGIPRMKLDKDVTSDDQHQYHLILWGDYQSNHLIQSLLSLDRFNASGGDSHFQWDSKILTVNGKSYPARVHVPMMITTNPHAPTRYIVLNSGPTHREGHDRTNSLQNPKLPDWAVINLKTTPNDQTPGAVVDAGFFNELWKFK